MNSRKTKKQKINGKKILENAKKVILKEIERLERDCANQYLGGPNEYNFDKNNLNMLQTQWLMQIFKVDIGDYNEQTYHCMQPPKCECKWPVVVDES